MNTPDMCSAIQRGMQKQFSLRQKQINQGERRVGWKAAFGAPQALEKFGISAPLVGFLTDKTLMQDGTTLVQADYAKPALEPEIAIHMGAGVSPGASLAEAKAAIRGLGPAIELADVTFPPDDPEEILAHNIYHRGLILGDCDTRFAGGEVSGLTGILTCNGNIVIDTSDVEAMTGRLGEIVRHFANFLAPFGGTIETGDVIIAGSLIPPYWVDQPLEFSYELTPIGRLQVLFDAEQEI